MACLGASLLAQGGAGPSLTNADVIKLVAAKLGDGVIITAIQSAPRANFDLSTDSLVSLKQNGASDAVIAAMQKAMAGNRPQPAAAPAAPIATPVPAGPPAAAARREVDSGSSFHDPAAEPSEQETLYLVDQSTGALTALKPQGTKELRFNSNTIHFYFPGAAAVTRFHVGRPFGFAIRFASTITEVQVDASRLLVDGDKRFVTKLDANNIIRFDVRNLGPATSPTANSKKGAPDTLYEITPRGPLLEGEYVLYVMWMARVSHAETWTIGFDNR